MKKQNKLMSSLETVYGNLLSEIAKEKSKYEINCVKWSTMDALIDQSCVEMQTHLLLLLYGPRRKKTCLRGFANNKGADEPAHPRSLISTFVIRFLENCICKFATGEISIF